jgi:tetratricopeptide (TPR) repeat protein
MEARARGNYAHATALLEESLAHHRAMGNREGIMQGGLGLSLSHLALVLREQGEHARATTLYEECLALHRELGDREGMGRTLMGLGDVARDQGDTERIGLYCEESLALFRELGVMWAAGFSLNNLALAAYLEGDLARAASRAEESEAVFRGLEAGLGPAEVLVTMGRVRGAQGQAEAARASLVEAFQLACAEGPRWLVAAAMEELGTQLVRQGQPKQGVHLLAAATTLRHAMGAPVRPTDRPALEDALAVARQALDGAAFTDAWATGQTLPLEQVVAYVLAGLPDTSDGAEPASGARLGRMAR